MLTLYFAFCFLLASAAAGKKTQQEAKNKSLNEHTKYLKAEDANAVVRLPEYTSIRYGRRPGDKNSSRILFWTPAYSSHEAWFWWFDKASMKNTCPDLPCDFTVDRRLLNSSDAVVFMVYGNTVNLTGDVRSQLPAHRWPHQRYVFFAIEPPRINRSHTNLTKLNGIFNWTMTYRRDSDVYAHFGKVLLSELPAANRSEAAGRDYAAGKTKLVAWFASHCGTDGHREAYVQRLKERLSVDIYGKCGQLKCRPIGSVKCKRVIGRYKFYLSFENVICKDYVTEKFMEALGTDSVPVVFGGADYARYAPAGSYVDVLDFPDPHALADYLLFLDENPVEYNRYFDWKRGYSVRVLRHQLYACELCAKLLNPNEPVKTYRDVDEWWNGEANCTFWKPKEDNK